MINYLFISFFIFLVSFCSLADDSTLTVWNPETIYAFAENLEREGDYFRAITEYRRVAFHWPNHPLATECRYRVGHLYILNTDLENAYSTFNQLIADATNERDEQYARYGLAQALYVGARWSLADAELAVISKSCRIFSESSILYSRLWCRLRPGQLTNGLEFWLKETPSSPGNQNDSNFRIRNALIELTKTPEKNPHLAGILSAAIPGTGQIYAGRWRDGLVSFLINGLFIGAIAAAIDQDHNETAAVLGFFELGFYSANIYNAVNDAHKTNRILLDNNLKLFEFRFGSPFKAEGLSTNP
ncbi:hypothetical protein JW823_08305 [bacterium]|nr:hypothetical protein [candidate division CSSED10-310 bacterium]